MNSYGLMVYSQKLSGFRLTSFFLLLLLPSCQEYVHVYEYV